MRSVLVDTGPLVALFNNSDAHHQRALRFLEQWDGELVTTVPTIVEATFLLAFSTDTQVEFLEWVRDSLTLDMNLVADLTRIGQIMQKYADLPADFADASLVALAERRGLTTIATIDKDFTIYRIREKARFRNVF